MRSPFAKADLFSQGEGGEGSVLLSQFLQFIMKRTTQHLRSALALLHDVHTLSKRYGDETKLAALPGGNPSTPAKDGGDANKEAGGSIKRKARRRSLPPPISDKAKTAALQAVAMARIGSFKVRKHMDRDRPRAPSTSLDALNLKSPKVPGARSKMSLLRPILQQAALLLRASQAERVAYVFTVEIVHVLRKIQPRDLIAAKWGPELKCILHESDLRIRWICSLLVSEINPSLRVELLRRLITIASECHKRKNYNAVFEFTVALSSPCVKLLKASWRHIAEKYKVKLQDLCALFWDKDMRRDYSVYRSLIANGGACVPVLSILSKDLSITANLPICHPKSAADAVLVNVRRILRLNEIVLNFSMHVNSAISAFDSELSTPAQSTARKREETSAKASRGRKARGVSDAARGRDQEPAGSHLSAPARSAQSAATSIASSAPEQTATRPVSARFSRADEKEIGLMFCACVLEENKELLGLSRKSAIGNERRQQTAEEEKKFVSRYRCPNLPTMEALYAEAKARDLHDNEMLLASLESLGF